MFNRHLWSTLSAWRFKVVVLKLLFRPVRAFCLLCLIHSLHDMEFLSYHILAKNSPSTIDLGTFFPFLSMLLRGPCNLGVSVVLVVI